MPAPGTCATTARSTRCARDGDGGADGSGRLERVPRRDHDACPRTRAARRTSARPTSASTPSSMRPESRSRCTGWRTSCANSRPHFRSTRATRGDPCSSSAARRRPARTSTSSRARPGSRSTSASTPSRVSRPRSSSSPARSPKRRRSSAPTRRSRCSRQSPPRTPRPTIPAAIALARSIEALEGRPAAFVLSPGNVDIRFYAQRGIPAFAVRSWPSRRLPRARRARERGGAAPLRRRLHVVRRHADGRVVPSLSSDAPRQARGS